MKHTGHKQEFLVIGRSTIESQELMRSLQVRKGHQGQRTIEKVIKGLLYNDKT